MPGRSTSVMSKFHTTTTGQHNGHSKACKILTFSQGAPVLPRQRERVLGFEVAREQLSMSHSNIFCRSGKASCCYDR